MMVALKVQNDLLGTAAAALMVLPPDGL